MMNQCGIIILAAGASTRMGVAKQSLEYQGTTLLRRAVETAIASCCRPIIVVLGARAEELRGLLDGLPVTIVLNPQWELGMGTSIRAGIESIRSASVDAATIFLCDQPLISASMLDRMVEAYFTSKKRMAAAAFAGELGTPTIFEASLFDQLLALPDKHGGKVILHRYPDQVYPHLMPEAESDVDTMEDFNRLLG